MSVVTFLYQVTAADIMKVLEAIDRTYSVGFGL
jgi:hypothetical protein